jgi:hypothetical protein
MRFLALLLCLVCALTAAEWRLESADGRVAVQPLDLRALASASALRLEAARDPVDETDAWIEVRLVTADGRRYAQASPLRIPAGERRGDMTIGFDAGSWASQDGVISVDALQAMAACEVAVHGWSGRVSARLSTLATPAGSPTFTVIALQSGLVEVGPWREWHLRLAGGFQAETGQVTAVDAGGRSWPMFLDQPGGLDAAGRWRPVGPARWTLRLRPDEAPAAPVRLHWENAETRWESPPLNPPTQVVGRSPLADQASWILPIPTAEAWSGEALLHDSGSWVRVGRRALPPALAPVLAWRSDWTGFRGPESVSWPQAAALDQAVAAGVEAIDLLPEGLADEQGPFRFGLSPWTAQDGPWRHPRDLWNDAGPWRAWLRQARDVVARTRAAPGLRQWVLGLERLANQDAGRERLQAVAGGLAELVARYDGRPLVARHPQLASFGRTDPEGAWYAFGDGSRGWTQGPIPLSGPVLVDPKGSDGNGCIAVPVGPGGEVRLAGAQVALDTNLFNLDRLELDAALDGGGEATLYAWVTDHHHRWWQQRLERIPGDGGWQTVGVDFSSTGAWTLAGGDVAWSDDIRRRIRAFGVVAYVRGAGGQARLRLDRLRRLGWPRAGDAGLAIRVTQVPVGNLKRWQPIDCSFVLNQTAQNPYDPDSADVIGEAMAADGSVLRHPAYWDEPYQLVFDGTTERAVPVGAGSWRWRWTPPAPGSWRTRLIARLKVRGVWKQAETAWTTTTVDAARGGMPTVGVDAGDPRWFSTAEGRLWYPIGVNLRSPGDERQDDLLAKERQFKPQDEEPAAVRGWNSLDWERRGTRAYERWFPLMRENGMDFARVWMCPWWAGLEWRRDWDDYGGLTWFNQPNAARMDRVMELAAENGVYVQVELMNHGMVGEFADKQWQDSPYNRANGGPCRNVAEWFRSDEVWKTHEKRLRYTLARWGWRTNLAAWVLCSELEFTGTFDQETRRNDRGFSPGLQRWLERSLVWMQANDPQRGRPVTMHWSHPWAGPQHWQTPGLGFSYSNAYTAFQDFDTSLGKGKRVPRSLPIALDAYLNDLFPADQLRRPTLLGEWGGHWSDNEPWVMRGELRTGCWLQAVTPYAGNTGFWWWLWLETSDQWKQYAAIARFMQGEERRGQTWTPIQPRVLGADTRLFAQGMMSPTAVRLYVWPRGFDQDSRRTQPKAAGMVRLDGLTAGVWTMRRFDGATGEQVAERELTADAQGRLDLPVSALDPDAVFKLDRR